jgi:Leucine-rich repeat (LRR) protein
MEKLLVFGNKLTSLPRSIKYLSNLRILDVRFNCLQEIPREISRCKSLEILKVSSNQISNLPVKALKSLPHLKKFYVTDNPLTNSQKKLFFRKHQSILLKDFKRRIFIG